MNKVIKNKRGLELVGSFFGCPYQFNGMKIRLGMVLDTHEKENKNNSKANI